MALQLDQFRNADFDFTDMVVQKPRDCAAVFAWRVVVSQQGSHILQSHAEGTAMADEL
jgi:hypothetical protein